MQNTLIKYYFTYIRTPQTANFQEGKKPGIYGFMRHSP